VAAHLSRAVLVVVVVSRRARVVACDEALSSQRGMFGRLTLSRSSVEACAARHLEHVSSLPTDEPATQRCSDKLMTVFGASTRLSFP
jgi:hypothetical protein